MKNLNIFKYIFLEDTLKDFLEDTLKDTLENIYYLLFLK